MELDDSLPSQSLPPPHTPRNYSLLQLQQSLQREMLQFRWRRWPSLAGRERQAPATGLPSANFFLPEPCLDRQVSRGRSTPAVGEQSSAADRGSHLCLTWQALTSHYCRQDEQGRSNRRFFKPEQFDPAASLARQSSSPPNGPPVPPPIAHSFVAKVHDHPRSASTQPPQQATEPATCSLPPPRMFPRFAETAVLSPRGR